VNEEAWGGLVYLGVVVAVEDRRRRSELGRSRHSGTPAVKRGAQTDASGGGESPSVLREARGGRTQPELEKEARRSSGGLEMIPSSLVARRGWCLRGMTEGGEGALSCVVAASNGGRIKVN
jgi:hypothetical protein